MLSFKKHERLKKKKDIDALFANGEKIKEQSFLLFWNKRTDEDEAPLKMAFSVSKKNVKSAVKRNRIKRQMREVYRAYKPDLYNRLKNSDKKYAAMLIYTSTEMPNYNNLKDKIIVLLDRYIASIEAHIE